MKISVALCTYNGEQFLREQLESIAAQTLLPHELVVCDDASRDGTLAVVCEFAQNAPFRVRIFNSDKNLGVVKNFERCIGLCEGEAIAPCDQDDLWLPQKLQRCAAVLQSSPDVGLVFSDAVLMNAQGETENERLWNAICFTPGQQQKMQRDAFSVLLRGNVVTGTAMMFRSMFKSEILPIPENIPVLHDAWIALIVSALSQVKFIEEPLLQYRRHAAQHTRERDSTIEQVKSVAHYREHLYLLETLKSRLQSTRLSPQHQTLLCDNAAHLQTRLNLPASRIPRTMRVLNELRRGRYARYSSGWRSALRDFVYGTSR